VGDELVARHLPVHKHRKMHTQTLNIHALSGIRTQDLGFRATEDGACLRPLGYRDRLWELLALVISYYSFILRYKWFCLKYRGYTECQEKRCFSRMRDLHFLASLTDLNGLLRSNVRRGSDFHIFIKQVKNLYNISKQFKLRRSKLFYNRVNHKHRIASFIDIM
jgi:hypothetical protein